MKRRRKLTTEPAAGLSSSRHVEPADGQPAKGRRIAMSVGLGAAAVLAMGLGSVAFAGPASASGVQQLPAHPVR
jgi:hypothetical protein